MEPERPSQIGLLDSPDHRDRRPSTASQHDAAELLSPPIMPEGPSPVLLTRSKIYALLAVCLMSVGSHFAMYLLGPLKSRLHREMGTSNSQFSLLIASFNLNSTWTPLVAGLFVTRFGTAWSSVATTFCVLLGQLILFFGVGSSQLVIMTLGLFVFGLGTTPLAVVQETLVSHLAPSHHLGLSLALGLVSGKSSSFISSSISLPLADKYGDLMPFSIAVFLCSLSFLGNWLRLFRRWGMEDGREAQVKEKRRVSWGGVGHLGDVFWLYILLNVLSGAIWQPFLHLSANLLQVRYSSTEAVASREASVLLAGAIILYPLVGYLTDRFNPSTPRTTFILLHIAATLTFLAYSFLLLPPAWTGSPWLAMILFSAGHGIATLLLVILVARLLPPAYVPLGLGIHKSMETASSSLSQTLAGLWLDWTKQTADEFAAGEGLLRIFWLINLFQLGCMLFLWRLEKKRRVSLRASASIERAEEYEQLPMSDVESPDVFERNQEYGDTPNEESDSEEMTRRRDFNDDESTDDGEDEEERMAKPEGPNTPEISEVSSALARDDAERKRGRVFFFVSLGMIAVVWIVFLASAWSRL